MKFIQNSSERLCTNLTKFSVDCLKILAIIKYIQLASAVNQTEFVRSNQSLCQKKKKTLKKKISLIND